MADTPQKLLEQAKAAQAAAETSLAKAQAALQAAEKLAEAGGAAAAAATGGAIDPTIFRLAIFVLAIFVGYYVVWSVTPALHTPLMSVTNAISSVIVVGALLAVGVPLLTEGTGAARGFGFIGLVLAGVNIFGGSATMIAALLGAVLIGTLEQSLTRMRINEFWKDALLGVFILLAVAIDALVLNRLRKLWARSEMTVIAAPEASASAAALSAKGGSHAS